MTELPAPPEPPRDSKDWTWVIEAPCPACGFDAARVERAELPRLIDAAADEIRASLVRPGADQRRSPDVWSRLEYACHVRDACRVFDGRLRLMLAEDDPMFPNWDQDETALSERYWTQSPAVVADELSAAAAELAASYRGVTAEQWERPGRRSNGSRFTVDTLGRYVLHDLTHHVHDVRSVNDQPK